MQVLESSQGLRPRLAVYTIAAMTGPKSRALNYADAGVSIDRGDLLVERIKPLAAATDRPGVLGGLGGFGALFDLAALNYRNPVLVSGTDGVGTKVKLAVESNRHDGIGIDLVAMNVNDLLAQGAEPLFFLDYYACGSLDVGVAEMVIAGIAQGCRIAGCALVGGETAEMPGLYQAGEYDVAGFCVGVVEKDAIIDGRTISDGDVLLGLASSGPHANGYSLIRRILADTGTRLDAPFSGATFADVLMEPTRIYVRPILELSRRIRLKGIAHVTGGGLLENVPRILPDGLAAHVDPSAWPRPPIFTWLQQAGNVETREMFRTFNCGIGLVLVVAASDSSSAMDQLRGSGETPFEIGRVVPRSSGVEAVVLRDVEDTRPP